MNTSSVSAQSQNMSQSYKAHSNVNLASLLTVNKGKLSLTIIPVTQGEDWLLPSDLILDTQSLDEVPKDTYIWQQQALAVYNLNSDSAHTNNTSVVVLEGEQDNRRLALLTEGELTTIQVTIADISDIDAVKLEDNNQVEDTPYVYQMVTIKNNDEINEDKRYAVPDLQRLIEALIK